MNPTIQIRKTPDGRIQARRSDGKPMTVEDREEARRTAIIEDLRPGAWIVEEIKDGRNLRAVKIYSALLDDHLWLLIDRTYQPFGGLAIYYPEELAELRTKTLEELREIHKVKVAFPGCRVIQEGAET
jgi:hypothetical protein